MQPSCREDLQRLSWPALFWLRSTCDSASRGIMGAQSESDVQSAPLKGFRGYWSRMPGLRVFCFSAQAVPRVWNILPPCWLPLPSYGQCTQEVSLKTWFVSLLSLQRDVHRAACPDHRDARRSEICHWAVSVEEDGNFGPLYHLPSDDHGLCACKKPASLSSTCIPSSYLACFALSVVFWCEWQIGEHFIIVSFK